MQPSKKTVFVTGAAGFIGCNLVHNLLANDAYRVIGIDRNNHSSNSFDCRTSSDVKKPQLQEIGNRLTVLDSDHHDFNPETQGKGHGLTSPIAIGENIWLGSNVTILKDVTIGKNSVISSGAVVTKIHPNSSSRRRCSRQSPSIALSGNAVALL